MCNMVDYMGNIAFINIIEECYRTITFIMHVISTNDCAIIHVALKPRSMSLKTVFQYNIHLYVGHGHLMFASLIYPYGHCQGARCSLYLYMPLLIQILTCFPLFQAVR